MIHMKWHDLFSLKKKKKKKIEIVVCCSFDWLYIQTNLLVRKLQTKVRLLQKAVLQQFVQGMHCLPLNQQF